MTKIELQAMEILIRELPKIRKGIENLSLEKMKDEIIEATPEELLEDRCQRLRENNIALKLELLDLKDQLKKQDNE